MKLDSVKEVPLDGDTYNAHGPIKYFDALCEGNKRDSKAVYNWLVNSVLSTCQATPTFWSG